MIADLWRDLRFALRSLRLRPGYSSLVILTLALGIGANVAIFNLTNAAVLRPLDVRAPEDLVVLGPGWVRGWNTGSPLPAIDGRVIFFPYALYKELQGQLEGVSIAARGSTFQPSIVWRETAAAADGAVANGRCASASFFDVLGVSAHVGRTFEPEDDRIQGARPVVVLSHRFWQLRFDSDPNVVGQRLMINGAPYQIIGVGPAGFTGATPGNRIDFWVPMGMANTFTGIGPEIDDDTFSWLQIIGRLEPGVNPGSVEANANLVLQRYLDADPRRKGKGTPEQRLRIELESGETGLSRTQQDLKEPLFALMTGVGLLLLIVYLNVSHLMLARAASRQHEMSIRTSLGATRGRLLRQLLTEGLVLASLGAAAGGLTAGWMSRGLATLASSGGVGRFNYDLEMGWDRRVVVFTLALTVGTTLVIGLVPAWHALWSASQKSMRSAARSVTGTGSWRQVSRILMALQVALSLVLLLSAGLLATSLARLRDVPTGLDEEHVLLAGIEVEKLGLGESRAQFLYEDIPRRLMAQPGVAAASLSNPQVFAGTRAWEVSFPGTERPPKVVDFHRVTPGYFDALGLRLLRGRGFSQSDNADAPRVAVINQKLAKSAFAGGDPIGQRIRLDSEHDVEIVGVVSDAHTWDLREPPWSIFFLPMAQPHGTSMSLPARSLEVRAHGNPTELVETIRRTVAEAQPGLTITSAQTLSQQLDGALVQERLLALLASVFGLSALLLVAVGLYGVISQWVTQRSREVGVRIALGATPGAVQRLVLRQALAPVASGVLLGILLTLPISKLLSGFLFQVEPLDPGTLASAALALLAVSLFAAYVPARRASRVEPVVAMRCE